MNITQSIPRPNESTLHPSLSLALDLTRRAGGINNYEAEHHGHATLTQRVHDLADLGYQFSKTRETWTDPKGCKHYGVVRYAYLGWERPQSKQLNSEVEK